MIERELDLYSRRTDQRSSEIQIRARFVRCRPANGRDVSQMVRINKKTSTGQTLGGSGFHIDQILSLHFDSVNMHVHSKARALSKPTRVVQIFLLIPFSKKMKRYQLHQFYNCEISSRLPSCHYITIWKPDSCDRVWKTPNVRWRKSRSKLKRNNNNYNDHKESNLPCYCLCRRNNSIL